MTQLKIHNIIKRSILILLILLICSTLILTIDCKDKNNLQTQKIDKNMKSNLQENDTNALSVEKLSPMDIQNNEIYFDQEIEQYLEELKLWHEEGLILDNDDSFRHEKLIARKLQYVIIKTSYLLEINRVDIAIKEIQKDCLEDEPLRELYAMILGFLFLGSGHFEDAINAFNQSLQSKHDSFWDDYIKNGGKDIIGCSCKLGQIIAHIGLSHYDIARNEFESFSKSYSPYGNILFESSIDSLIHYFSFPNGLYKLIVSNKSFDKNSENDYEIIEGEGFSNLNYRLPFTFYFELDTIFAQKHEIDTSQYPVVIPAHNTNADDVEKQILEKIQKPLVDPFMEELNRQNEKLPTMQ